MGLKETTRHIRKVVVVLWFALAAFTAICNVGTASYFAGAMPRSPQPEVGRVYPAGGGHNVWVFVTKNELAWEKFVRDDLMTAALCGVVALGIVMLIREHKGRPPIKNIRDLWS